MSMAQKQKVFLSAMEYMLSNGVTSVHDMDGLNGDLQSYNTAKKFREAGKLNLRIYAVAPLNKWESLKDIREIRDNNDKWIRTGGLKGFVDGSLGSRTAIFHDDYNDKKKHKKHKRVLYQPTKRPLSLGFGC